MSIWPLFWRKRQELEDKLNVCDLALRLESQNLRCARTRIDTLEGQIEAVHKENFDLKERLREAKNRLLRYKQAVRTAMKDLAVVEIGPARPKESK